MSIYRYVNPQRSHASFAYVDFSHISGLISAPEHERLAGRQRSVVPLEAALEVWTRAERGKLSRHSGVARAMDYMVKRWVAFSQFVDDGCICMTNNAAERALRGIAIGRKAWLLAGSDRGGERGAAIYTLIATAKLNGLDPRAWLADVLRRIADHVDLARGGTVQQNTGCHRRDAYSLGAL